MKKILIANRGEIACRIARTAHKMGIAVVAVYSEADRHAPHVRMADEAVCIGPAPSTESYLRGDRIIEAARKTGADAIHPGYGFLSEQAHFVQAVAEAGLTFIGPSPQSIELMGSKLAAKEAVARYDIPLVPGTERALSSVEEARRVAQQIGYPVLIKASAGGGGKGMRIVETEEELPQQMERAISEAQSAFGDGAVFIEKFITRPRHIEIQILADRHGHTCYLFERECSIQRRHQKVIEEAPSALLTPEVRRAMGQAAVRVAQACQYEGAGTVEFLVDDQLNFYFLEMNTRLQVEHPVTEMITGLDLVEQQIRIARGEPLPFRQDQLRIDGHSIELRVYAEDPFNDFLPGTGRLLRYEPPCGEGIRVDDGYEQGMEVPIYYDPMLAKLIVHAPTRMAAIRRMLDAIQQYHVEGVPTTLPFGRFVMRHEAFRSGHFDTHFVKEHFTEEALRQQDQQFGEVAALVALRAWLDRQQALHVPSNRRSSWYQRRKD